MVNARKQAESKYMYTYLRNLQRSDLPWQVWYISANVSRFYTILVEHKYANQVDFVFKKCFAFLPICLVKTWQIVLLWREILVKNGCIYKGSIDTDVFLF